MYKILSDSLYYIMIIWFLYGYYDVTIDKTFDIKMKIISYVVDSLSIIFILMNIFIKPQYNGFIYFLLGFGLMLWYMYFITQDMTDQGYTPWQRTIYLTIDYLMVICICGGSMFFMALEKIAIINGSIDFTDYFKLVYCP